MKKLTRSIAKVLFIGFTVLPGAQTVFAQVRTVGPAPGAVTPAPAAGRPDARLDAQGMPGPMWRGSMVIGSNVDLLGGSRYGTVQDLIFGNGGCVEYAVVAYQNQFVPIPWDLATFEPGSRVLQVNIDAGRIRELPFVRQMSEIDNRQFFDKVHTYYRADHGFNRGDRNLNPGERRHAMDRGTTVRPGTARSGDGP